MNVLYVSRSVPFDGISHAGGKTFNYYIKGFAKSSGDSVTLISYGNENDFKRCDCEDKGIRTIFIDNKQCVSPKLLNRLYKSNFLGKYCGMHSYGAVEKMRQILSDLSKEGYYPDVVVLEWTQITILINLLKEYFPNAKYVASEHDVYFLGLFRKYKYEEKLFLKLCRYVKYKVTKIVECKSLLDCDMILCHNIKDAKLLEMNGVCGANVIVPYYDVYSTVEYSGDRKVMTFFGAMSREENYKSVIWFIDNILPGLSDLDYQFCILGSNPPEKLRKYGSDKILVTGFVDDITPYLNYTKIAVLPLLLGAGIKVKVLEFAAAGIPVVTNQIGIEGIPFINGKDYLHCESPTEFIEMIRNVWFNTTDLKKISENAKANISKNFDLEISLKNYISWIQNLYKM